MFIPIETKVREFLAKTLLGCICAEKGFAVVIGKQDRLRNALVHLPKGIYLDKGVAPEKEAFFRKCLAMDHRISAFCEEGLVLRNPDSYIREMTSAEAFEFMDLFFAWGKKQKSLITSHYPQVDNKIILSGNPRMDLLRPQLRPLFAREVADIRKEYGPFLLINTNFNRYNHFRNRDFLHDVWKQRGKITTDEDENFFYRLSDHVGKIYQAFYDVIPRLSATFPEWTIVVRPHPSENHQVWKDLAVSLPNVKVVHKGNVIPWILASEAVMHNSCTTGLEAFLCDRPVVSYRPVVDGTLESPLPNEVSMQVFTVDELLELLIRVRDHKELTLEQSNSAKMALVRDYVSGLDGELAADRIATSLKELAGREKTKGLRWMDTFMQRSLRARTKQIKKYLRTLVLGVSDDDKLRELYKKQKFPDITLQELETTVKQFRTLTSRFSTVKVKTIKRMEKCFLLYQ
jgi:surface carbohydrate biosynthesis protein